MHESLADAGPSLIEFWDLAEADKKQDIEGWRAPFDGVSATSPEVKLSRRIQAEIKRLIQSGTMTGHDGARRPLRYGDVLVLVRRRGNTFDAVIQALKHAGIPVAGVDRLKLTEHIAIIDLMNLADALLLPRDDLALAVALKSPLFGLDDDDLFELAWQRKGSLRQALAHHGATNDRLRIALERLEVAGQRGAVHDQFGGHLIDRHRPQSQQLIQDRKLRDAQAGLAQHLVVHAGDVTRRLPQGEAVAQGVVRMRARCHGRCSGAGPALVPAL